MRKLTIALLAGAGALHKVAAIQIRWLLWRTTGDWEACGRDGLTDGRRYQGRAQALPFSHAARRCLLRSVARPMSRAWTSS